MINFQKVWATMELDEKMAFRDKTIAAVKEIYPHFDVGPIEPGDAERFLVENEEETIRIKVPLRDLFSRFSLTAKTNADLKKAIFEEYAGVFNRVDDVEALVNEPVFPWIDIKEYVRVQHYHINTIPEDKLHYPFCEGVVTAFVIEKPGEGIMYWVNENMLNGWGKTKEELYATALDNLGTIADGFGLVGTNEPHFELWPETGTFYASTVLLLPSMRYMISQMIGSPFRFGIPSAHRFYAWSDIKNEKFQIEMKAKMEREIEKYPSPLTSIIFEVDEKGQISVVKTQPTIPPMPLTSNN